MKSLPTGGERPPLHSQACGAGTALPQCVTDSLGQQMQAPSSGSPNKNSVHLLCSMAYGL
eukprot:4158412-Prymnesium_polylepis.1